MFDTPDGSSPRPSRTAITTGGRHARPGWIAVTVRPQAAALTCVAGSLLLWIVGFAGADPRELGRFGLLSLFNSATVTALILLLGSMLVCIYQNRPGWVVGAHLVTYLALVHGTPAVLYGTVRYAWSYKHLGVVDYIARTGQVDTGIDVNPIYHNWPGLFAASAWIADLGGDGSAMSIALWAPLGFNLILLVVLRYLFRGLTENPAVVWLALLVYFTMTWVGQDYFSPQAIGNILYIAVAGFLLRHRRGGVVRTLVFALVVTAVTVSHQITLVVLLLAIAALVVLRRTAGWYLPVIAVGIVVTWAFTIAGDYTTVHLEELVSGFGQPLSNADATFSKSEGADAAQRLVVWGDRFTVFAGGALALLGVWRTRRRGTLQWSAVILMLVPVTVVVAMSFGGEALLRVFLFSAPFISFLAAEACAPRADREGVDPRGLAVAVAAVALLLPGFLLGYYGKERQNYFTSEEVAVSEWVAATAPAGSLLVEGDTNYPRQFSHYEKFDFVAIAREPSVEQLEARPAQTLQRWLSGDRYVDGYVLITRSQNVGVEMGNSLSPGSLTAIDKTLSGSPLFTVVYESRDAKVFTLSELGRR